MDKLFYALGISSRNVNVSIQNFLSFSSQSYSNSFQRSFQIQPVPSRRKNLSFLIYNMFCLYHLNNMCNRIDPFEVFLTKKLNVCSKRGEFIFMLLKPFQSKVTNLCMHEIVLAYQISKNLLYSLHPLQKHFLVCFRVAIT